MLLLVGTARAHEAKASSEEAAQLAWANFDPRREGAGLVTVSSDLGILDPQSVTGRSRTIGGGFAAEVLGRGRRWPLFVGLGLGVLWLGQSRQPGPTLGLSRPEGGFYFGATAIEHSLELRHAELLVRVQPWSGRLRPYVEGATGLAALWGSTTLRDIGGSALRRSESQRSVSFLVGVSVGLDVLLLKLSEDVISCWTLVLSAGVRRLYTGAMAIPAFAVDEAGEARISSAHERMRLWQPFLALTINTHTNPRPTEGRSRE